MKSDKSSYVNHPLNKSPSKTTYSFGKSERFPDLYYDAVNYELPTFDSR